MKNSLIMEQDVPYRAAFLVGKGCKVQAIVRHSWNFNTRRIEYLYGAFTRITRLFCVDLNSANNFVEAICKVGSNDVHNLAARSYIKGSFTMTTSSQCCSCANNSSWTVSCSPAELMRVMMDHDMELARQERILVDAGPFAYASKHRDSTNFPRPNL
jgi:hypothetical protein